MLGKVFKAYDIREKFPKPLSPKLAWQIGWGAAQFLLERAEAEGHDDPMMKNVVVGFDMRTSSPELTEALEKGLRDFGAGVINVGRVDTPFIAFAVNYLGCCGGIMVTASHNPPAYNGFKICRIAAKPVGMTTGLDEIRRYAAMGNQDKVTPAGGLREERDLWEAYRRHVHRHLAPELLDGSKKVTVAIDASNGMAGEMVPKVFGDVKGLTIKALNFETDGTFKHEPNPLVEANLAELQETVRSSKAQVGICFDGDADRCVAVDETGRTIGCDLLTAWLAEGVLAEEPGASIVHDLRSSRALRETVEAGGGTAVRSRVGHVFLKQQMAEHDAAFGGELSGHFYFRDNFYADSGAIAFAMIVSRLAGDRRKLSTCIAPLRESWVQSGEINFEVEDKDEAMAMLEESYPKAEIDHLDGVTVDCGSWWCNVRPSNTEPLLRLNLEAKTAAAVDKRVEEVSEILDGKRVDH
jgi:phosphomannomutase